VRVLSDRLEVDAERAIVALSPALRSRISIDPAPPRTAAPAFRPGDAIKLVAVYDEPFWRRDGLSGMAWGDALPFSFTRDAAHGEPGVLAIFAVGARARRLRALAAPERDRQVTRALVRCFGARAARPIALAARDWTAEAWSLGGYGSTAAPGDWTATANARPRSTDDRIVLAGTESSAEHHGYMEGAVRAAERAAATVLAAA
jgi:monoamine oxidase